MREQQAETQQAQSKLMQMLGMIFVGQEQQRLTNEWVAGSITTISASSGVAIEAAPEQQAAIAMPPALVRLSGVAPDSEPMVAETTRGEVAAGSPARAAGADGGGASANGGAKWIPKLRTPASGGGRFVDCGGDPARCWLSTSQEVGAAADRRTTARRRRLRRWTGLAMAELEGLAYG